MKKNKYWFRKRRGLFTRDLGWGYTPVSWEGWTSVIVLVMILLSASLFFSTSGEGMSTIEGVKLLFVLLVIIVAFVIFSETKTNKNDVKSSKKKVK
ncbi:hypothetical protein HOK51_11365 [Candidatus Woesearchaeota archaeon]|jgi:hypothetical protein|nr:hypothetical protein [Candidatus Woesearchaeota archaeon]MBT6520421.1 hypothetical protein [Candidatus Woesearchaeota archaeon]MBT7368827.1 hypothetical protein [Candidatus Woesearchaeota archaeon]